MKYDVIIIGAGPAGMTAALYAARANLNTLLLERGIPGGQMNNTAEVENYPGFDSILGPDLALKMYDGINQFGVEHGYGNVVEVKDHHDYKEVITDDASYEAKVVIIATGCEHRNLEVPGEAEYSGRGVSYCAVCDGPFFRGKEVAVIGGGNSAIEESLYLAGITEKVHIIMRRDVFRADDYLVKKALNNEKIEFHFKKKPHALIVEEDTLKGLELEDSVTKEVEPLYVQGIFPFIGLDPVTDFVKDLGITNEQGYIDVDEHMETSIQGLFAIGDVRTKTLRQVVTAANDGAIAGQYAAKLVEEN